MVEHVAAVDGLSDVALESGCREIVESKKFAPSISEVMATIKDHVGKWRERRWALTSVEDMPS